MSSTAPGFHTFHNYNNQSYNAGQANMESRGDAYEYSGMSHACPISVNILVHKRSWRSEVTHVDLSYTSHGVHFQVIFDHYEIWKQW